MLKFKSSKILLDGETVAEQLRGARQAKKIKLEDAAKKLNISYKYLRALEQGEYDKLPAGVYGKNFLREYAFFLGFSQQEYDELAQDFAAEKSIGHSPERKELFSKQRVKRRYFFETPKFLKSLVIVFIIFICFVYLGFKLNKAISQPLLIVYSPMENFITEKHFVEVSGKTESESRITINGEQVLSNTTGEFSKTVNLKNGINTIVIISQKKYGRDKIITRQIMVKGE